MKQANRMVGASAISAVILIGLSAPLAQAGYVVTLEQVGGDVVATGSGAIDLTGLSLEGHSSSVAGMEQELGGYSLVSPRAPTCTPGSLDHWLSGVDRGLEPTAAAETLSASLAIFPTRLGCQRVTSRAVPCRTLRPTTPSPCSASA
jgi:hypothetical protein